MLFLATTQENKSTILLQFFKSFMSVFFTYVPDVGVKESTLDT